MWFSELPFLTALQAQQMWAHTHDVNLFSAGANGVEVGSGGTGAYRGSNGPILLDFIAEGGNKVYVYKYLNTDFSEVTDYNPQPPMETIDTDVLGKRMDNVYLKIDTNILDYKSQVVNIFRNGTTELCHDKLCCEFTAYINVDNSVSTRAIYTYHFIAYSGVRSFTGVYNGGIEICGIIACLNRSISSCGQRFPNYEEITWPVGFESITIKANFENSENKTQYPNSLLSSIRPINASLTNWIAEEIVGENGENLIRRTFSTNEPQSRLLTFAIYGRNFELDSDPQDSDNGNSVDFMRLNLFLLGVALFIGYMF